MKIDVIIAMMMLLLMPKSDAAWKAAGATMDEETGVMKPKAETTKVAAHLRRNGQLQRDKGLCAKLLRITDFLGLSGSWGPFQLMMMLGDGFLS